MPGLAKTLLVDTLGRVLGLDAKRIQFTPDLDALRYHRLEVLEETPGESRRSFRFIKGPIFTQLLMADEINRASPKTQSALLQADAGAPRDRRRHSATTCPSRSTCSPTQNPLEQEGTYPLPEAQLDRFLLEIDVTYPDLAAERRMLYATTGTRRAPRRERSSTPASSSRHPAPRPPDPRAR